jgi:hypothetical protein
VCHKRVAWPPQAEDTRARLGVPKLLALVQDLEAATKLGQLGLVGGFAAAEEGSEQFWCNAAGDGAVDKVHELKRRPSTSRVCIPVHMFTSFFSVLLYIYIYNIYIYLYIYTHMGVDLLDQKFE